MQTSRMLNSFFSLTQQLAAAPVAQAHCDGPCGVYDPAQARVSAEAVVTMTQKLIALEKPSCKDEPAMLEYRNTVIRYVEIKEQQAHETKEHLLVLWTDYFKPEHLEKYPELHELIWKATKACSHAKQHVSLEASMEVLDYVKQVHEIFWATKGREVEWVTAAV